jgi:hypothetical protein
MLDELLSPTLAWMVASLTMPQQFAAIMQESIARVNEQCKRQITEIAK